MHDFYRGNIGMKNTLAMHVVIDSTSIEDKWLFKG